MAQEWNLPIPEPVRDYWGMDFEPLTAWRDVSQPVLLMNGEHDTLVDPVDAVARIGATLEDADVVYLIIGRGIGGCH